MFKKPFAPPENKRGFRIGANYYRIIKAARQNARQKMLKQLRVCYNYNFYKKHDVCICRPFVYYVVLVMNCDTVLTCEFQAKSIVMEY